MTRLQFLLTSLFASVAALFGVKRKAALDPAFGYSEHTYTLKYRLNPETRKLEWQWRDDTGKAFSEVFDTQEKAIAAKTSPPVHTVWL